MKLRKEVEECIICYQQRLSLQVEEYKKKKYMEKMATLFFYINSILRACFFTIIQKNYAGIICEFSKIVNS